jgi:hypothetical protein
MTLATVVVVVAALLALGAGLWLYTPDLPRPRLEAAYLKAPTDYLDVAAAGMIVLVTAHGRSSPASSSQGSKMSITTASPCGCSAAPGAWAAAAARR